MDNKTLLEIAEKAREYSYSPYSNFKVGAALLTKEGKVFTGCNIECASFGATNCAERTAIFKAISEGYKDIEKIAIASSNSENDEPTYPCGIWRQDIVEFGLDIKIVTGYSKGKIYECSSSDLMPNYFSKDEM